MVKTVDWTTALSTTAFISLVLWLGRNVLITRLKASVQHEFDRKLEMLSAEIKEKSNQIDSLRRAALSGVQHRQAVLYDRKLKATEDLWSSVISMAGARNLSAVMVTIKFDMAAKEASHNAQFREVFKAISKFFDITKLDLNSASKSRPYLSKLAWAYFSAYQAIVMYAVIQVEMLKAGIDNDFSNTEQITKLIKTALPHQEEYIEKYGLGASYHLLEEIEEKLLGEIDKILNGIEDDQASLAKAAKILKESELLMGQLEMSKRDLN